MVSDSGMRVLVSLRESGHAGLACMLGELRSVGLFPVAFMVLVWLVLVFGVVALAGVYAGYRRYPSSAQHYGLGLVPVVPPMLVIRSLMERVTA